MHGASSQSSSQTSQASKRPRARFLGETVSQQEARMRPKPASATEEATPARIPPEITQQLRSLAHDLSNSVETVMQACYLLSQAKLDEANQRWVKLVDSGARDAGRIIREMREILRSQEAK